LAETAFGNCWLTEVSIDTLNAEFRTFDAIRSEASNGQQWPCAAGLFIRRSDLGFATARFNTSRFSDHPKGLQPADLA